MGAAIDIEHVSKHFKLNHARADSLKERVVNFRKSGEGSVKANVLDEVAY